MTIEHDAEHSKYIAKNENGQTIGELLYTEISNRTRNLFHTEVFPEFEGQGVGKELANKALMDAKNDGFKIQPSCPFIHGYIQKHEEFSDLVA